MAELARLDREELERQADVGHYVTEEMGSRLSPLLEDFLDTR